MQKRHWKQGTYNAADILGLASISLLHAQHRRDICAPVMQAGLVAPAKKRCCRSTADMWALVAAGALADTPFLERSVVLSSFCRRPLNNLRRTSPKEAKSPLLRPTPRAVPPLPLFVINSLNSLNAIQVRCLSHFRLMVRMHPDSILVYQAVVAAFGSCGSQVSAWFRLPTSHPVPTRPPSNMLGGSRPGRNLLCQLRPHVAQPSEVSV